ncbi:hypothetical protein POM88_001092 [Heracleum sosnowskyi]|uniref:Uncharacterized protein n=1 Tax=Heracleum sosnowskyi TaxID=360622 RepID=A0AAD8JFG2_9APIA|nr:hypothetical protein POM88_001092 [Heracleum sosnowskyi]
MVFFTYELSNVHAFQALRVHPDTHLLHLILNKNTRSRIIVGIERLMQDTPPSIDIYRNPPLPDEDFTRDIRPYALRLKKMTFPSSSSTRHPIVTRPLSREKALEELQRPHPKRSDRPPSQASPSLFDEVQSKVPSDASSRSLWETYEDESLATKDLEDVSRTVALCNYDYIPELSDGEAYNPPSQPMLEGVTYLKGRNKTREGATLCCKDLPTSLKKDTLAKAVEQYQKRKQEKEKKKREEKNRDEKERDRKKQVHEEMKRYKEKEKETRRREKDEERSETKNHPE